MRRFAPARYLLPIDGGHRFAPALPEQRQDAVRALLQRLIRPVGRCGVCDLPGVPRVLLRLRRDRSDLSRRQVCVTCLRSRYGVVLTDEEATFCVAVTRKS